MSINSHTLPDAEIVNVIDAETHAEPPFFAVSTTKLMVMFMCTLSLYQIYWFYQNWTRIKVRSQPTIAPALRTLFGVFFCYQCFAEIRNHGEKCGVPKVPAAGLMATGWIVCTVLWKLPDPYWLITFGAIVFILPIQVYANAVNGAVAPNHNRNSRFTLWNWVAIVPGGLMMFFAALGILLRA